MCASSQRNPRCPCSAVWTRSTALSGPLFWSNVSASSSARTTTSLVKAGVPVQTTVPPPRSKRSAQRHQFIPGSFGPLRSTTGGALPYQATHDLRLCVGLALLQHDNEALTRRPFLQVLERV